MPYSCRRCIINVTRAYSMEAFIVLCNRSIPIHLLEREQERFILSSFSFLSQHSTHSTNEQAHSICSHWFYHHVHVSNGAAKTGKKGDDTFCAIIPRFPYSSSAVVKYGSRNSLIDGSEN